MKLQLLYSLTVFWFSFEATHAALSPEVYWKVKLPNTQIPKIIKDFLPRQADDEVRELKQDKTGTTEKVLYYSHQPYKGFAYDRAASEDEIHELKQDNIDTKERVYYNHQPYKGFSYEVRELREDKAGTEEKVYYSHQPYRAFSYDRAATENEVQELKHDKMDTKEKVYYSHQPYKAFAYDRASTEDEVRELKQAKTNTKERVYYSLHKPITAFAWHYAATEDEVRELKQDKTDTKKKVYYGSHQQYKDFAVYDRVATEDEVRALKKDKIDKENECHEVKKERHNINNELQQVTEERSARNDLKENYLFKPFFLEKDFEKGNVINFPSLQNKNEAPFLPRQFVESIPFSLEKFSEILNHFSIDRSSKDAQAIKETIKLCEEPEIQHKEKHTCATSLESMVDFSLSVLGTNNIMANATKVEGKTQMLQKYTIEDVQHIAEGDNMVCHKLTYAYAVHYCHVGGGTKTFMVSMVGADGTKVKAVTVCHKDTSFWNPKGLPFVILNVKPGTTPICHFLQDDQILFVPSK